MQTVIVKIDKKTGETTYEVNGVTGSSCLDITAQLVQSNEERDKQFTHEIEGGQELPQYIDEA
jgi:hypothetical protein